MDKVILSHSLILRFFRNREHVSFFEYLVKKHGKDMESIVLLKLPFGQIKSLLEIEIAALKRERKTAQARKLKEANQRRVRAVSHIKLIVEASFRGADTTMQKAAAILDKDILSNYKDMPKATNVEELTEQINRMVGAFSGELYAPAIASLRLGASLARLSAANENFKAVYAQNKRLAGSSPEAVSIQKIRAKLDVAFTKLADTIDMIYKVNELGAQDAALHGKLRTVIHAINTQLHESAANLSARGQKFGKVPQPPALP